MCINEGEKMNEKRKKRSQQRDRLNREREKDLTRRMDNTNMMHMKKIGLKPAIRKQHHQQRVKLQIGYLVRRVLS